MSANEVRPVAFIGELVRVEESDHSDGVLIVSLAANYDLDPEIGLTIIEISRAEARELIQGLAALL